MIKITLPMPRLGETMEQGTIASWLVAAGDSFKRGEPLLELETDKTLVEYPALGSGTLLETLVGPGDVVDVGSPIAVIESEDAWSLPDIDEADEGSKEVQAELQTSVDIASMDTAEKQFSPMATDRLRATPVARKMARKANIELTDLSGTGRRGRIEARDVIAATVPGQQVARTLSPVKEDILLVHGFAGDATGWAALESSLKRRGRTVTAIDLPGHGSNDTAVHHPSDLVAWLSAYLSKISRPVHLVGHSLGAYVSAQSAANISQSVARLTLITPAGCGHEINGSFVSGMAQAQSQGEVSHLLRLLGPKASTLTEQGRVEMAQQLAKGRLRDLASSMVRGNTQCIDTISAIAALPDATKIAAIFGVADTIIPKEHVFNLPPRVAVHILRAGHMPQWDTPAQVERLLDPD